MKFWCQVFLVATVGLLISVSQATAQTLTEKLLREDAAELVKQARAGGDVVRGAILFHQGNINCAKCHRPKAEEDRIGPNLANMDTSISDLSIVQSILQPSQTIKEGFESTIVLNLDGQMLLGTVVRQDEEAVVLRDHQDVDKLVTVPRAEIDEIRPGTTSSMPDNLVDELKNRKQFLDLLRYVLQLREQQPVGNSSIANSERELSSGLAGLVLMQKKNCVACHDASALPDEIDSVQAPRLAWSASWLNPDYIQQFIVDPHLTKTGSDMPGMLGHLSQEKRIEIAEAISHFLLSKTTNKFQVEPIDEYARARGFELFHSVGCVACHSTRAEGGIEDSNDQARALGDLRGKFGVDGLVEFLEHPLKSRPAGHMPGMQLTHRDAIDISHFLLQEDSTLRSGWNIDDGLAQKGKQFFVDFQCAKCHTDFDETDSRPKMFGSINKLSLSEGCLSRKAGTWPQFNFNDEQIDSIRAAITKLPPQLSPKRKIDFHLASFNCLACHDRDGLGGVTAETNPHFKTDDLNLGDQGRLPPTLTGVGAKLKPKWMRDVMVNGRSIRPYMKTRMPQFGETNIQPLIELFQSIDELPEMKFASFEDQKEVRKKGLELAGNRGLNCVACHTYKFQLADTMPAADLTEMAERLKKDWFYQYMMAPDQFSPNTVMPAFWPGGVAIRKDLEGTAKDQIESLWQYLLDGRQAGSPRGVVRERLEIVVDDEAKMLRRSYPGIGKRGIGVGYPGGVNIAFDAEQMRLGSMWLGKFADPGGVWNGQGHGNVRPMGRTIEFPKGPDLDSKASAWQVDDGRPPLHKFKGYALDSKRRPLFRYTFDGVRVEDHFLEVVNDESGNVGLRRTVRFTANEARSGLRFRLYSGESISRLSDSEFQLDDRLRILALSDLKPTVVELEGNGDSESRKQLEIQFDLHKNQVRGIVVEYQLE